LRSPELRRRLGLPDLVEDEAVGEKLIALERDLAVAGRDRRLADHDRPRALVAERLLAVVAREPPQVHQDVEGPQEPEQQAERHSEEGRPFAFERDDLDAGEQETERADRRRLEEDEIGIAEPDPA